MTAFSKSWNNEQRYYTSPTSYFLYGKRGYLWRDLYKSASKPYHDLPYVLVRQDRDNDYCEVVTSSGQLLKGSVATFFGGGLTWPPLLTDPWTSNDTLDVYNKLGEMTHTGEFNPAIFLAEANESLGMIASTATSLGRAIHRVKKGDMSGAAKALGISRPNRQLRQTSAPKTVDEISGRWLELQYGWLPLLGDMHNAAQAVASVVEKPQNLTFRVRKYKEGYTESTSTGRTNVTWGKFSKCRYQLKVTLTAAPDPFALTLSDPFAVAWELVPFSFVADWFLPIGDYLNAQRIRSILPVGKVVRSRKVINTTRCVKFKNSASTGYLTSVSQGLFNSFNNYVQFTRYVESSLPNVPMPSVKNLDEVVGYRRAASAIALAWSRFR